MQGCILTKCVPLHVSSGPPYPGDRQRIEEQESRKQDREGRKSQQAALQDGGLDVHCRQEATE